MGLRVLITNIELWPLSGTVLYVRDLALELQRQGHEPVVFSLAVGEVARELRQAGIPVIDTLRRMRQAPDIVHGHHHAPTTMAVRRWPTRPAIFICHDHRAPKDRTPLHPSIRRYLGVSRVCVQRLVREGVPAEEASLLLNFVDTRRFTARPPLPERPCRALVFSNYAHAGTHLPAVTAACREAGLQLDVVGAGAGNAVDRPEEVLGHYDIVFAKGKAAMEAMAVGAAVILCDFSGVGPLVTSAEFDDLRPLNFGFQALRDQLAPDLLLREIARYDAQDAMRVRDRLRSEASLEQAVKALVALYHDVMTEHEGSPKRHPVQVERLSIRGPLFLQLRWRWRSVPPRWRNPVERLPGVAQLKAGLRRLMDAEE
jgi:hypothetical protein